MCHAYQCGFRGNLMTLMHGWVTGTRPAGDKLKGDEFHRVKNLLANDAAMAARTDSGPPRATSDSPPPIAERNIPLIESVDEKVRDLATLDQKFVVDVAAMPPASASYVRRHSCLSPDSMNKWRAGILPLDGGHDKRGFSLRGNIIYPVLSEDGQVLAWIGRDPNYEQKEKDFARLSPPERTESTAPMKHRFPKGFHRGLELFGQEAIRLKEPGYRESIARHGILVVEGFNDVIGLDNLGIPAVAIMSNRVTEHQIEKIARWAKHLANGKASLLFDCEQTGDDGAKEALWLLVERGLNVRLGWSQAMHGGAFKGRQPENLIREEWETVVEPALKR